MTRETGSNWRDVAVRTARALACGVVLLAAASAPAAPARLRLPERPPTGSWLFDYAGELGAAGLAEASAAQKQCYRETGTIVYVVILGSRGEYGGAGATADEFAEAWYRAWEIGVRGSRGADAARGVLVLVARADRAVSVVADPVWDAPWRAKARRAVTAAMLPRLQTGRTREAVVAAVQAARGVAEDQARGGSTAPSLGELVWSAPRIELFGPLGVPWPAAVQWLLLFAGLGGLVGSAIRARRRPVRLLVVSALLVVLALGAWVLLALAPLALPRWRRLAEPASAPGSGRVRALPELPEDSVFVRW